MGDVHVPRVCSRCDTRKVSAIGSQFTLAREWLLYHTYICCVVASSGWVSGGWRSSGWVSGRWVSGGGRLSSGWAVVWWWAADWWCYPLMVPSIG